MTRIFTTTFYGEYEHQYVDVAENYDLIKKIIYKYIKNNEFKDRFIEFHIAKGIFINKPILIKLSSITEIFDISDETND